MTSVANVTVIAPHPNYPFGRFYPGTKYWLIQKSIENGVTVWRLPYFADHSLSSVRRTLSYLSFAVMAILVAPFVAGRPKTVWVYHGPFMTALAGLWFKFVYRSRLIFTCADLWPESFVASGLDTPGLVVRLLHAYRRFINRQADLLICSTQGTVASYKKDGISADRLDYVPVWVDGINEDSTVDSNPANEIVYAGNFGPAQPLEVVIEAAGILEREGHNVRFSFFGTGSRERELRDLARLEGVTSVAFHGRVSPEKAFAASSTALAQIVALRSSPLFSMTVPSKLFFSFAAGSPIIFSLEGEAAQLARDSEASFEFDARSPETLVAAVKKVLAMPLEERTEMRKRMRAYYTLNFSRDVLLARYRAILGSEQPPEQAWVM